MRSSLCIFDMSLAPSLPSLFDFTIRIYQKNKEAAGGTNAQTHVNNPFSKE